MTHMIMLNTVLFGIASISALINGFHIHGSIMAVLCAGWFIALMTFDETGGGSCCR